MANYVGLDKGFLPLSTYNSSNASGVQAGRFVKLTAVEQIDVNSTASGLVMGVVMENADQVKVATGKVTVDVRMAGIAPCVAAAAITIGAEVASATDGRVQTAVSTNRSQGVALQAATAAGDIINVLLGLNGRILP